MAGAPYVELHAHSAYSFLDGASTPSELAGAAAALGYGAFALTDHDGVWGAMEFTIAAKEQGLRAINGAELSVSIGRPSPVHVTLLVEDAGGWRNLCRLLTLAHTHTRRGAARDPGQPWVTLEQLEAHAAGLVCLTGCARQGLLAGAFSSRRSWPAALEATRQLLAAFGPRRLYVELQRPFEQHDRARNRWLAGVAERLRVRTVATGDVHSHVAARAYLQDVLVAIAGNAPLEATEGRRRANHTSALVSPQAMALRFRDHPEAVAETLRLAERLQFDLTTGLGYRYPGAEDPHADPRLGALCRSRLQERYAGSPHRANAERRLEEELELIRHLGLGGFFLLHHELIQLARDIALEVRGADSARALLPPARGRGSSVSSIVCYLTGLSHVDPLSAGLSLGRFLNEEVGTAGSMPDIDIDLPRDVRERLIPRVHERYGADRSALVAAFPTYQPRSAVRDLGKALSLPAEEVDLAAKALGHYGDAKEMETQLAAALGPRRARERRWRLLARLAPQIMGLPRHASQHPGGMVISTRPLIDICPVVPTRMEGRQIVMWDKDSCADAGLLKLDLLGLGMLSAVERTVAEIERVRGERVDLSRIPLDDADTYRSIQAAETTGVFQIESRAQQQMLPRTRPESLEDLTVQVALIRPGPIQGGAVHPYIERRQALRADPAYQVPYEHPSLAPVLAETLGVIVYQEQVIGVAVQLAGFSVAEAENLRRAMSRKRSQAAIDAHRQRFVEGACRRHADVTPELAERVWEQIQGFSGFGFPKAHSAAFGLLAYQSAWLRVHYGAEFLCALLNEQPMGFYPPDSLVHEAQRRNISVAPPEVNRSLVLCHVERLHGEGLQVRIGLGYVKGAQEEEMETLVAERERTGLYAGVADLAARSGVGRDGLERLAWAGALDGLTSAGDRRAAYWQLGIAAAHPQVGASQAALSLAPPPAPAPLRPLDAWQQSVANYAATGINLGPHPLELLRDSLGPSVCRSAELAEAGEGASVEVAGIVTARQRPETARGVTFLTLEDESGTANLIVNRFVYERSRLAVRTAPLLWARGRLEHRGGPVNVIVAELRALDVQPAQRRDQQPPGAGRTRAQRERALAELRAALPGGHSFGRRR